MKTRKVNFDLIIAKTSFIQTLGSTVLSLLRRTATFTDAEQRRGLFEKANASGVQELTEEEFRILYTLISGLELQAKLIVIDSLRSMGTDIVRYEEELNQAAETSEETEE